MLDFVSSQNIGLVALQEIGKSQSMGLLQEYGRMMFPGSLLLFVISG